MLNVERDELLEETFAATDTEDRRGTAKGQGPNRRKSVVDRRSGAQRRQQTAAQSDYTGPERRQGEDRRADTGLERRRGPGRRLSDERRLGSDRLEVYTPVKPHGA